MTTSRLLATGTSGLPVNKSTPSIVPKLHRLTRTIVYETYWRFAAERQRIFRARVRGSSGPWTNDHILNSFKFTNAYRAADRTSQWLIREVIYQGPQTPEDIFFRVMLFKLFNKIATWRLLDLELGPISWDSYEYNEYDRVLSDAFRRGRRIYSAAYIIPPPRKFGHKRKHRNHLALLESLMRDDLPRKLQQTRSMQDAFDLLRAVPSFGDFLAYQYVTDLNYSTLTDFSEREFVVAGPGALSGIHKCFGDIGRWKPEDVIRMVTERQEEEFARRGLQFEDLWGRSLQLIDCQNLFCEVDKYAREAHPSFTRINGRWRIKQSFEPNRDRFCPWFPPEWGLNDEVARELACITAEQ